MKVLILGGAGMLGHQIFLKLKQHLGVASVACTLRKSKSHYDHFKIFQNSLIFENVDILDFLSLKKTLENFKPEVIINCIGLTLRKPELSDLEKCIQVNSMLPHKLAKWGLKNNCRIIHFSTDCVFDGSKGNYLESDVPNASDLYGQSKFLGEIGYTNSLTLRLSIVGRELEGKTELIEWFLSQKGKSVKGYSNAIYSGLTTNFVAGEVIRILKHFPDLSGVYQLSSEKISKLDLLKIVNEVYQTKTVIQDNPGYISDKTLNCDLYIKETGFQKPTWKNMIEDMKKEEKVSYEII